MSVTQRTVTLTADGTGSTQEVEVTSAPQDSIELSLNAKGEPSWSVKVYGHDAGELDARLEAARGVAEAHAARARARKEAA